jgi:sugar O-acyltransferase (sialic acid O-acetyltransferase NeuD family)
MKKKLIIIGAGGLGREILFLLSKNSKTDCYDILGFIDNIPESQNKVINNFPVLGDDTWLHNYNDNIDVVIAVGSSQVRKQIYNKFSYKENISFPTIIANNAICSDTAIIGKGCIIGYHAILNANVFLGDFVLLNSNCAIGNDAKLENFVTLYGNLSVSGNVSVGSCAEIGNGVRILQNKTIGENSKVGIGSVVIRNVPPNCTVFGNPAKRIF